MIKSYLFFFLLSIVILPSCTSVKSYQKMYINDPDMRLSDSPIKAYENGFQTYREGVAGGNGGKTGGGCGCN